MRAVLAVISQIVWKFLTLWLVRADAVSDAQRKAEVKSHDRINEADLGVGASDAANISWLHDFHAKHGDR
jgi:hypothetical protein